MSTLIAEDVLLLLLDDSGAFISGDNRKPALAGAVLTELALTGAVEIETENGLWKRTRVWCRPRRRSAIRCWRRRSMTSRRRGARRRIW